MKKKNGFTLIELLVTIALMLSILGIAIVSFINISNKKKEDAWGEVKSQVETAATEYFTANEYMFEGLADGSSGYVSIGKLEEEDYISKVTNPTTGKSVNKCTLVKVTKKGSNLIAEYDGNIDNANCGGDYKAYMAEPGAPTGTIRYYKTGDVEIYPINGWFNIDKLGEKGILKVCIESNTNGNGAITKAMIGEAEATKEGNNYCTIIENDNKYPNVLATLTNASGKSWKQTFSVNKDTVRPEGIMDIYSSVSGYNSNVVNTYIDVKDNLRNVTKVTLKDVRGNKTYASDKFTEKNVKQGYDKRLEILGLAFSNGLNGVSYNASSLNAKLYDEAGNTGNITSSDYLVYKECGNNVASQTTYGSYGSCTKSCGGGTKTRSKTVTSTDNATGKVCSTSTGNDTAVACNTHACDTTPPTIVVSIYKKKASGPNGGKGDLVKSVTLSGTGDNDISGLGWFNKSTAPYGFYIEYSANEDLSSVKWFWNDSYLTWNEAQSNTYKWNSDSQSFKGGGYSDKGSNRTGYVTIEAEGARRGRLYFRDKSNNLTRITLSINMDRTPPTIKYITNPTKKSCGGAKGVYVKYEVSDSISGVNEVYHYYGEDTGAKRYDFISGFDIRVLYYNSQGYNGPYTIERTWAVGNPKGCASENPAGPNTSWCYYNNTAVKDYAGNTATGISGSCSKVGK